MGAEPTTSLRAHSPTSASLESLPRSTWSSLAACLPRRRHLRQLILLLVSTMILLWTAMFYYHSTDASNSNPQPDDISTAVDNQTAQPPADTTKVDTTTTPYQEPEWPKFQSWNTDGWVKDMETKDFLHGLQAYTTQGHTLDDLPKLEQQQQGDNISITAVIQLSDETHIVAQLNALLEQTRPIDEIVLVCPSSIKQSAEYHAQKHTNPRIRVLVVDPPPYQSGTAGESSWLQVIHTLQAEWIWVLDQGVLPGKRYLEHIHNLMHTNEYKDALLGVHGVLLPANLNDQQHQVDDVLCLPDAFSLLPNVTQPVDMIQGAWLLRREWLPILTTDNAMNLLETPLPYYISRNLQHHASLPSIILPFHADPDYQLQNVTCKSIIDGFEDKDGAWKKLWDLKSDPSSLDWRQRTFMAEQDQASVLLVADGPEQAIALHPLVCRYNVPVHLVVTGANRGMSGDAFKQALAASACKNAERILVHDLAVAQGDEASVASATAVGVRRLAQALRPRVVIHIRQNQPVYHVVDAAVAAENITTIALPAGEIRHALWIADLSAEALQHWNDIQMDLIVITDRRPHSLSRLLQSASRSHYLGDTVSLKVHLEQSADRVTRMLVNGFSWNHGPKTVRHRIRKGGLMPAIIESWYPVNDDNYAVLLEDDIEVSPLFYAWAKYSILQYRYSGSTSQDNTRSMYGISLYSPRHLELLPEGRRPFDPNTAIGDDYGQHVPYLSQVPCSWGAVYFPEHWREFHSYLTNRLEDLQQDRLLNITVPGSRSERWKKSWKKYFIELVYLRSYVMLYPNFQLFESFSTNHLEFGTHVKKGQGRVNALDEFLVPLMQRDTILSQLPDNRLPVFGDLPVLDLWGQRKPLEELDAIGAEWHKNVSSCARQVGKFDAQDLLCPVSKHRHGKKIGAKKQKPADEAVEPLVFVTQVVTEEEEQKLKEQQEGDDNNEEVYLPTPIDVSQMSSPELDQRNEDDELLDLEQDIETLNKLYQDIEH